MNLMFMFSEWFDFHTHLLNFEEKGLVTRTFRRLDPPRQQAVVNAILEESAAKGPAALNIKEVAARAGVSVGSLYQYFHDRDGLLDFAIELCVRYLTDAFALALPYMKDLPLGEALRLYLSTGIEWGQTEAGLVRFFGRAAYQGDPTLSTRLVQPIADVMRQTVYDLLAHAAQRGELRPGLDLEAASRLVNALLIAIGDSQLLPYLNTYFQITAGDVPSERILDVSIDFIMKGIGINTPNLPLSED